MDVEKFQNDVSEVTDKIASYLSEKDVTKLNSVKIHLIDMYKRNLVKINHSVAAGRIFCRLQLIDGIAEKLAFLVGKLEFIKIVFGLAGRTNPDILPYGMELRRPAIPAPHSI